MSADSIQTKIRCLFYTQEAVLFASDDDDDGAPPGAAGQQQAAASSAMDPAFHMPFHIHLHTGGCAVC